jgi:hypothetical protein
MSRFALRDAAGVAAAIPDAKIAPCLSDTQLVRLAVGSLDEATAARIDEPVDQCTSCRDLVGKMLQAHNSKSVPHPLAADGMSPAQKDRHAAEPAAMEVGRRYRVHGFLGQGGMGRVHRGLMLPSRNMG